MQFLKLQITFLNGTYHGLVEAGNEEWPPSPMRLFQAMLATAKRRHGDNLPEPVEAALDWLAQLAAPTIVTPPVRRASPIRASVPNNAMDICARAWSRGSFDAKDAKPSTHKAMKTIAPVVLEAENPNEQIVRYFWELSGNQSDMRHCSEIGKLARQLVCVGWGLDLVAGHAEFSDEKSQGVSTGNRSEMTWQPGEGFSKKLRVANMRSRSALEKKHMAFISRLSKGSLEPVPALSPTAYQTVGYGMSWEPVALPFAAFSLIETDGSRFIRFPTRKGSEIVGMLRHATRAAAEMAGWNEEKISRIILGHGERIGETHESVNLQRFAYVPLPSLEPRRQHGRADHVGMIRRVLIYTPTCGMKSDVDWLRRSLAGSELIDEKTKQPVAMLSSIPASDTVVNRYSPSGKKLAESHTWSTVTPVVLPKNYLRRQDVQKLKSAPDAETKNALFRQRDEKIEALIRLAIEQAGFSKILSEHAFLDWSKVGYWPGALSSDDYFVPNHLKKFPRFHVRITWRDPQERLLSIPGPIVIGGGRFFGLGLFAAE